jgi:hypothetical protein
MKKATRISLVALCLAGTPAIADVHFIDWLGPAELRETPAAEGVQLTIDNGVGIPGETWPFRVARVEIPPDSEVDHVSLSMVREGVLPRTAAAYAARSAGANDPTLVALGPPSGESEGYRYWILPSGDFHGYRIAHVAIVPFREVEDEVRVLTTFHLDVATRGSETHALRREISHPRTDEADRHLVRSALDAAPKFYPRSGTARAVVPPELAATTIEYLIVTSAAQAATYQELATIKTKEGMPAAVTTIEWILANYAGIDLAGRVRSYLRDAYLYQGLRYALLAGDTDVVPTRVAINRFQFNDGVAIAVDKYFACLDGDWNADSDDEMGEAPNPAIGIEGDHVDLYWEIGIGRASTSSVAEAQTFLAKWKSYTGYDAAHFRNDYQHRFLALGEVLFPDDWEPGDPPGSILLDGADICESTLVYVPPSFSRTRMYQYYNNPEHPGAVPEIKDSVVVEIDSGYGWIDHVGHGFRTNMSVGDGKLTNEDAENFTNTDAYSVMYAVNCTSGAVLYDCIMERLMGNPAGGIIAGIASTDFDYPSVSDVFKFEFFRLMHQENRTRMSDAFYEADLPWIPIAVISENAYRWTVMTLLEFGDPAIEVWPDTPANFTVTHAATMPQGTASFSVTVKRLLNPVEGAVVCLQKSDGYAVGVTNSSGIATIPFIAGSTGTFNVTVTKSGFVPARSTASVVAATSAALRVTGWTLHDGAGGGTGNGNGRPDPGESIVFDLTVKNDGVASATGVQTTLHARTPFLTVTDSVAAPGTIGAGATQLIPAAFAANVPPVLPDSVRHVVAPAVIDLASAQGSWSQSWPFSVYQRLIDIIANSFAIIGDDGDGVLETGETAEIHLSAYNRGEGAASGVVGVATYSGSQFVLVEDTINFGTIAPAQEVSAGSIRLLSTGGSRLNVNVGFTVSDATSTALLSRSIDALAPPTPDSIVVVPASSSITLSWPPVSGTDVRGYLVSRSGSPGGPFVDVTPDFVEAGSFYTDEGLPPLTTFYYRILSVDYSGNRSAWTSAIAGTTSPPVLEGWPVDLPAGESKGSPTFADVDYDSQYEVVLGWNYPMVFRHDGGDFVDGDNNTLTTGIFDDTEGGVSKFWNSPVVFDIDRDGMQETIFAAWQVADGNGHLYVIDATGAIESGWPQEIGKAPWSTPAIGNVDGDEFFEIFVSSGAGTGSYQGVLFGFNHNGVEIRDGDGIPATKGIFYKSASLEAKFMYGSPALGDIDDDGREEIVFHEKTRHSSPPQSTIYAFNGDGSVLSGFPVGTASTGASTSSPAIADLDGNGDLEIVCVTENQVIVLNHNGSNFSGWPKSIPAIPTSSGGLRDFMSSPAIGDIDGDTNLDIALGWMDGQVHAWRATGGTPLSGFPTDVSNTGNEFNDYMRSPILGNVDTDIDVEIVVSSGDAKIYAINKNGTIVPGFPVSTPGIVFGSAALCDLDRDGKVNLIVQSDSPVLTVYDLTNVPFNAVEQPWSMFRHNRRKNGFFTPPTALDAETPSIAPSAAALHAPRPNPFSPIVHLPFDVPTGGDDVRIRLFDVDGRAVRTLANGHFPAGRFEIAWDGRTESGKRLAPGIYFARVEIGRQAFVQKVTMLP